MAREKHDIPTGRIRRASKVGRLAASQTVKQMGTRAANVTRDDEASQRALERRQIETAEQIVAALGTMKGAAMKLGQMMSFLDVGLVPEDYREEFQAKLASLRDAAPKVSFKDMRKVIEQDLDGKLKEFFDDFEEEAIAAASIGQVYRATTVEGREVAVKVQYPGVNRAVRSDMQNLGIIMRLMQRMAPGLDAKGLAEEIRERIHEELDYELEAANQRRLARIYRGHPFIVIPDVLSDLSRERVMVTEFVSGRGFDEVRADPATDHDRLGEIIFRFYYGCMYRQLPDARRWQRRLPRLRAVQDDLARDRRGRAHLPTPVARGALGGPHRPVEPDRLPERAGADGAGAAAGLHRGRRVVVPARRGDHPDARGRVECPDGAHRPARQALRPHAPRVDAARAPLRPPPRDPHPRGARAAAPDEQLAPHRSRVDVRRRAGHRARPRRGRLLHARRSLITLL
jgi:hypothetical protein